MRTASRRVRTADDRDAAAEAKRAGEVTYDGDLCAAGHTLRYTGTAECAVCQREASTRRRKSGPYQKRSGYPACHREPKEGRKHMAASLPTDGLFWKPDKARLMAGK